MDYPEALAWLYDRQRIGIKLGLQNMEQLLQELGNPHENFNAIHVAGTNGKGSVVRMLGNILTRAGFRVGTTTSPHLIHFQERFEIDGTPASQEDLLAVMGSLRPAVEAMDARDMHPTFFECTIAIAFLLFARRGVEWAIVETGLGGRLDATNVLAPALTIITDIAMDHSQYLGDSVADIAWEKAGIMKPGVPCVTSASGDALRVLKGRSHDLQVRMSIMGEDYHFEARPGGVAIGRPTGSSEYRLGLDGEHQARNATIVVAACDALQSGGVFLPPLAIHDGLRTAVNPGRLTHLKHQAPGWSHSVEFMLDGAHNPSAAGALAQHMGRLGWTDAHLVFGSCSDKAWQETAAILQAVVGPTWATPIRNTRSLRPEEIRSGCNAAVTPCQSPLEAIEQAVAAGAKRILVAGSLFLVGEVLAWLQGIPLEDVRANQ